MLTDSVLAFHHSTAETVRAMNTATWILLNLDDGDPVDVDGCMVNELRLPVAVSESLVGVVVEESAVVPVLWVLQ